MSARADPGVALWPREDGLGHSDMARLIAAPQLISISALNYDVPRQVLEMLAPSKKARKQMLHIGGGGGIGAN